MPEPYWLLLDGIYADRVEAIQKITNSDITRPIPISEANAMMRKAVFQHMRYRQRK